MPRKLSKKQILIINFIRSFADEHGLPPTIRDIQKGCKISSTSVVDYNLRVLERDNHITRRPDIARGIELPEGKSGIPLLGYIAAGEPLPDMSAEQWNTLDPLEILDIPPHFIKSTQNLFALKVKGTSMIDSLIDDGDIVVIQSTDQANDGDTVVAWLKMEQESTLKRIYYEKSRVRLQPANKLMAPIYTTADNIQVQGKLVSVMRTVA